MKLIDKNKLLEELKKLKQNLSASPIVVIEDIESLVESLEVKDVDLDKESMNYLLNEHKSPLTKVMHGVDLGTEMQYHKDIQDAFKAGYNKAMEEYVKGIPLQSWQTPCADPNYPCENPQMDCINCPRFGHPQGTITMTNMEE